MDNCVCLCHVTEAFCAQCACEDDEEEGLSTSRCRYLPTGAAGDGTPRRSRRALIPAI
jgi:hypothetical protein